jgi:hypothetical protein
VRLSNRWELPGASRFKFDQRNACKVAFSASSPEVAENPVLRAVRLQRVAFLGFSGDDGGGGAMKDSLRVSRLLRVGAILSTLYLLVFGGFETYSAGATALDKHTRFPAWESYVGWALFALPCLLVASIFLLYRRRSRLGFSLLLLNLSLYAAFIVFDFFAGKVVWEKAMWHVTAIWAALFLVALLAGVCLKAKSQAATA